MELIKTQGFKSTDVGMIPEDWKLYQVIDLIDLLTDFDANGSFASVAENVKVYDYEKYAWYVRSTDLEKNSSINEVKFVDESSYKFLKKTALYGDELLFLKRGDIGNVYLFKMKTKYATVAPNLYLLKLNNISNSTYLYYFFISSLGQRQLKSKNASSTLGALYKDDVKSIYVPLPPTLEEQKAIATALSDVDDLITNLDKLITKKKDIKQGAMQQLLTPPHRGGKRLPGFTGEWVEKKLGEVFNFKQGLQCAVEEQFETEKNNRVRFVRIIDLTNNSEPPRYIAKPDISHIIKEEDLFMVRYGSPGLLGFGYAGVIANNLFRLIPRIQVSTEFFYHLLQYRNQDILNLSSSTTMAAISFGPLSNMEIYIPIGSDEQKAIAEILSDMDKELKQLETKKAKYQSIKQGMMQELLTGKTRLV